MKSKFPRSVQVFTFRRWTFYVGWGRLDGNHHYWIKSGYGTHHSFPIRTGFTCVELGKEYTTRKTWGLRFYTYRWDASCCNIDLIVRKDLIPFKDSLT